MGYCSRPFPLHNLLIVLIAPRQLTVQVDQHVQKRPDVVLAALKDGVVRGVVVRFTKPAPSHRAC